MLDFKPDEIHERGEKWPRLSSLVQPEGLASIEDRGNGDRRHYADALFVGAQPLELVRVGAIRASGLGSRFLLALQHTFSCADMRLAARFAECRCTWGDLRPATCDLQPVTCSVNPFTTNHVSLQQTPYSTPLLCIFLLFRLARSTVP